MHKAKRFQHDIKGFSLRTTTCEFDERNAVDALTLWQGRNVRTWYCTATPHIIHQCHKRAISILRNAFRIAPAKLIVENFQTYRSLVPRRHNSRHKAFDIKIAFAWHVAEMSGPVEQIHLNLGRICKVNVEDLIPRNTANRIRVNLARQCVKAIQNKPNALMIRTAHDLPCITVIIDVLAPCKRLKPNTQTTFGCPFTQLMKILRHAINPAKRLRVAGRAYQQQIGSQFLHQIKLTLGAIKGFNTDGIGQSLKIAKGLEQSNFQPFRADQIANVARIAVMCDEILFEYFQTVKTSGCDRIQLFCKISRDRNGRDCRLHKGSPARARRKAL